MPKLPPNLHLGNWCTSMIGSIPTFKWLSIDIVFNPKWFRAHWRICPHIQFGAQELNSWKTICNSIQFNLSCTGVSGASLQVGWPSCLLSSHVEFFLCELKGRCSHRGVLKAHFLTSLTRSSLIEPIGGSQPKTSSNVDPAVSVDHLSPHSLTCPVQGSPKPAYR